MPSRDPDTGKRICGHAQRLRKEAREAPDPPAKKRIKPAAKKRVTKKVPALAGEVAQDLSHNPFAELGAPPIEDTSQLIRWSAQLHALATYQIAQHPEWWTNHREWMRALNDATSKFGAIKDRAAEQQKIAEALRRDEIDVKKAGLVSAHGRTAPKISRPPG